jgi:hypothetical protein
MTFRNFASVVYSLSPSETDVRLALRVKANPHQVLVVFLMLDSSHLEYRSFHNPKGLIKSIFLVGTQDQEYSLHGVQQYKL